MHKNPTTMPAPAAASRAWQRAPIHPFACGVLVILIAYLQVQDQVLPRELVPSIIAVELFVTVCIGAMWLITGDLQRAALAATVTTIVCILYPAIAYAVSDLGKAFGANQVPGYVLLLASLLSIVAANYCLLKRQWRWRNKTIDVDHGKITEVMNFVALVMLLFDGGSIALAQYSEQQASRKLIEHFEQPLASIQSLHPASKPDVYYILLDGFANTQTMRDYWGYDNTKDLISFLKQNGFYVVPAARSNYDRTELSMSSTFTMQHLDWLRDTASKNERATNNIWRLLENSPVLRAFKSLGYKIVNVSSGSGSTDWLFTADTNIRNLCFNHWSAAIARLTPLAALDEYVPILRDNYGDMRLSAGAALPKIAQIPGPKFVLIHTELAHAPCIFDAKGNRKPLPRLLNTDWGTPEEYTQQVQFCQSKVKNWLTYLLNQPGPKPIIIIQSDHGPQIKMASTNDYFQERMRIINAAYFPGKQGILYGTVTPVNTFRIVFNQYFGAQLPLVPDRSVCAPVYEKTFDWQDVTNDIKFKETGS